jgi:hypothetical protein
MKDAIRVVFIILSLIYEWKIKPIPSSAQFIIVSGFTGLKLIKRGVKTSLLNYRKLPGVNQRWQIVVIRGKKPANSRLLRNSEENKIDQWNIINQLYLSVFIQV